jgi:membrane fusion protein (multidrug efflux system)
MNRRVVAWVAAAALVVLVVVAAVLLEQSLGAQPAGELVLAADVRAQSVVVNAPSVVYPTINVAIGIPTSGSPAPSPSRSASSLSSMVSRMPTVSGRVTEVYVALGSHVTTGQPLAQLDTTMLDLGVTQARAAATQAHAQVALLGSTLDTLSSTADTLTTARAKLVTALSQATSGRAKLLAAIAALETIVSHIPTGTPLPTTPTVPPDPRILLAQLKVQLTQLDAALALLRSGLAQIATGRAQVATARTQLETAHDVLEIAAQVQDLGIQVAEVERDQARILSPVSGVVTYVLPAGSVAMVGTPLDTIVPDRSVLVDTYIADSQISVVRVGERADVSYDSAPGAVLHGQVTTIGSASVFPPSSFPTNLIHLTRALQVTVTLDPGPAPPPGTPVDLTILTNG